MTTAVLVIDVQHALSHGRWAMWESLAVIDRINGLTRRARAAGLPVVMVQHEEDDEGGLVRGSEAWQLAPGLDVAPGDLHVHKRASDAFHGTELQQQLQALGVTQLVVCGMQSEFCVDSTVRRALALGFPVTLASDAHTTTDNGVLTAAQISASENATLSHLGSYGPRACAVPAADIAFG